MRKKFSSKRERFLGFKSFPVIKISPKNREKYNAHGGKGLYTAAVRKIAGDRVFSVRLSLSFSGFFWLFVISPN